MGTPLRVLIVEDSEDDAELLLLELRRGGFEPSAERVETEEAMRAALDGQPWDLMIVDYALPHFSAPAALAVVRELSLDAPFIIVSGQIGEETAVAMMKGGAHDYIMKDHLARFLPTVQRELREAEVRRRSRRAEHAFREESRKAQQYLDVAAVMLVALDDEGRVALINRRGCDILGYEEQEVVGKDWFDHFIPASVPEEVRSVFVRVLSGELEAVEYHENPVLTKSGDERVIAWHNACVTDEAGHIIGTLSSGEDITERRRAEEMLTESEEWRDSVFDGSRDAIFIADEDGGFVDVNEAASALTGYSREELGRMAIPDLHDPEELHAYEAYFDRIMAGEAITSEAKIRRKDGTKVDTEFSNKSVVIRGKLFMHTTARDITERKRAEDALRESQRRYEELFNSGSDMVLVCELTSDGMADKVIEVNDEACRALGFTRDELLDLSPFGLAAPESRSDLPALAKRFAAEKQILFDTVAVAKGGASIPVEVNAKLVDVGGRPAVLSIARDITQRKRLEKEVLEISDAERRRIGHELHDGVGQELTGIRLMASALTQKLAARSAPEAEEAKAISTLLDDTAEHSHALATGMCPLELVSGDLVPALEELALTAQDRFGVSCGLQCEGPAPAVDDATATHLYHIAQEALTNAVKHGKAKHVELALATEGDRTTLAVRDDGVGLPEDADGLKGLGLRIMRYRADVMGASLDVRRHADGGTLVVCAIPPSVREEGGGGERRDDANTRRRDG